MSRSVNFFIGLDVDINYMKKYTLILILALVLNTLAASGEDGRTYVIKDAPVPDAGGVYVETVSDVYGRQGDNSFKLMEGMAQSNKVICQANGNDIYSHKYIVFEAAFAPVDGLDSVTLQTAGAKNVSVALRDGWLNRRWNSLRIVCSEPDSDSRHGYATFYVNDEAKLTNTPMTAKFDKNMRISFNGIPGKERLRIYIGGYSIYYAETHEAPQKPQLCTDGVRELFDTLYITDGRLTVGGLKFANAVTGVYSDGDFDMKKSTDEPLADGDAVIAETDGGQVCYYGVRLIADENKLPVLTDDFSGDETAVVHKNCTARTLGGKLLVTNVNNISEAELDCTVPDSDEYDMLELTADIYPESVSGVQVMTNRGVSLSPRIYTMNGGIESGKWSALRILYKRAEGRLTVSLNGVKISDRSGVAIAEGTEYRELKIVLFGKEGSTAYVDNYAVNCVPRGGTLTVAKGDPGGAASGGICGKAADDKSLRLSVTDPTLFRAFYRVNPSDDYADYKYLVYEANIAPVSGVKSVYLQTTGSARVSRQVTEFESGRWNHFMFVYEVPTAEYPRGRTTCYLNGAAVFADDENIRAFDGTNVRIAADSTTTQKVEDRQDLLAYLDDINVYMTNAAPTAPTMPKAADEYGAFGGIVTVADGFVSGTVSEDGTAMRAYRGDATLGGGERTAVGDRIAAESGTVSGEMKYSVYTAAVLGNDGGAVTYKYPSRGRVIIAEYAADSLVGVSTGVTDGGISSARYTLKNEKSEIRIFVLDSFDTLKPIYKSLSVRQTNDGGI